jgi:hypothetical protein
MFTTIDSLLPVFIIQKLPYLVLTGHLWYVPQNPSIFTNNKENSDPAIKVSVIGLKNGKFVDLQ